MNALSLFTAMEAFVCGQKNRYRNGGERKAGGRYPEGGRREKMMSLLKNSFSILLLYIFYTITCYLLVNLPISRHSGKIFFGSIFIICAEHIFMLLILQNKFLRTFIVDSFYNKEIKAVRWPLAKGEKYDVSQYTNGNNTYYVSKYTSLYVIYGYECYVSEELYNIYKIQPKILFDHICTAQTLFLQRVWETLSILNAPIFAVSYWCYRCSWSEGKCSNWWWRPIYFPFRVFLTCLTKYNQSFYQYTECIRGKVLQKTDDQLLSAGYTANDIMNLLQYSLRSDSISDLSFLDDKRREHIRKEIIRLNNHI